MTAVTGGQHGVDPEPRGSYRNASYKGEMEVKPAAWTCVDAITQSVGKVFNKAMTLKGH